MNRSLFSSKSIEWATPVDLFKDLNRIWQFDLDVCANAKNAKCPTFFNRAQNGLKQSWVNRRCWMNPPYGREIGEWVEKADYSGEHGLVVALLPARTDTRWFQKHCLGNHILFFPGRLKFEGAASSAPFPSCLVFFDRDVNYEIYEPRLDETAHLLKSRWTLGL